MKRERLPFEDRVNPRMLKSEPLRRCNLDDCHGACCVFGVWVDSREVTYILNNANLIGKVYFPRLVFPIASVGAAIVDFFRRLFGRS